VRYLAAIKDTFEDTRSIIEPAGALGVAGVKKYINEKGIKGVSCNPVPFCICLNRR
jgi:threonine dehydratase